MKVLFATSEDYLSICLWDGLQEVLGEENVFDATGCSWLHKSCCLLTGSPEFGHWQTVRAISGTREGRLFHPGDHFDLIIASSSFKGGWGRFTEALRPSGKIVYLDAWDAAWQISPPPSQVDAVFRREISRVVNYPYRPIHLGLAFPARWEFQSVTERVVDVFFSGNPDTCWPPQPVRWPALGKVFQTRRTHKSVIATRGLGYDTYFDTLRRSKLALCLPAADNADALRTYEAVACGAIPIFVGYPDHIRDPWFPNEACISCTVDTLAEHIDEALAHDLTPRREVLMDWALKHHTTAARARKVLEVMG